MLIQGVFSLSIVFFYEFAVYSFVSGINSYIMPLKNFILLTISKPFHELMKMKYKIYKTDSLINARTSKFSSEHIRRLITAARIIYRKIYKNY